jgi:hypothetical protein
LEEAEELYRFVLQGLVQHYGASAGGVIKIFKIQLGIIGVNLDTYSLYSVDI